MSRFVMVRKAPLIMAMLAIGILSQIIGCAGGDSNPLLEPYVWEFEQLYGRPVGVTAEFKMMALAGTCNRFERKIYISVEYWNNVSGYPDADMFKEAVVFHELGHCVLGREHDNAKRKNGNPVSLMALPQLDGLIYAQDQQYYRCELFYPGAEWCDVSE